MDNTRILDEAPAARDRGVTYNKNLDSSNFESTGWWTHFTLGNGLKLFIYY